MLVNPCLRLAAAKRVVQVIVSALILALPWSTFGGAIEYVYDDLGRVIAAVETGANRINYSYDANGNVLTVSTVPATQVGVLNFSPKQGPVGSTVIVSGSGFSTTPSSNTVRINGTAAVVTSATLTSLTITVPAGATTGLISVTSPNGTASSANNFVVATTAPAITSFTPNMGQVGTAVTVSGINFDPVISRNQIRFNTTQGTITSATPSSIATTVPSNSGSGRLKISTPTGVAESATDFFVLPATFYPSQVSVTDRLTIGVAKAVPLTATRYGMFLFEGVKDQLLTLGVSNVTANSIAITVRNPDGSTLENTLSNIGTAGGALQLPKLPRTGTYTIELQVGTVGGSATLTLAAPQTGTLTVGGAPLNLSISPAGRRALISFAGSAGQAVDLTASGVTVSSSRISVLDSSGVELIAATIGTAGGQLNPILPSAGTYTVFVDPVGSVGGAMTLALANSAAPLVTVNGSPSSVPITTAGQAAYATFQGVAGQSVNVAVLEPCVATASAISATVSVLKPDSVQLSSASLTVSTTGCTSGYSQGNVNLSIASLPFSGTYKVKIQPPAGKTGSFTVAVTTNITGNLALNSETNYAASYNGQGLRLTFSGTAGQYLSVGVFHTCSIDYGFSASVLKPDGTVLSAPTNPPIYAYWGCASTSIKYGTTNLNLPVLPVTGTYTVLVQPTKATKLSFTVSLTSGVQRDIAINSQTQIAGGYNGQGMQFKFDGTVGQYLSVGVFQDCSVDFGYIATILRPDGVIVQTTSTPTLYSWGCASTNYKYATANLNLPVLTMTGSYTILVQPTKAARQVFTISLTSGITGTLAKNSQASYTSTNNGQGVQLTFAGTAGQYPSIGVFHACSTDYGYTATVIAPDGSQLYTMSDPVFMSWNCASTNYKYGSSKLNIPALPATGNYTLLVQPTNATKLTFTITYSDTITSSIAVNSETTFNASYNGQGLQLTFSGTAGQYLSLGLLHGCTLDYGFSAKVLNPDGTTLATSAGPKFSNIGCTLSTQMYGTTNMNLPRLPTTGTYTVLVSADMATKLSYTISLSSGKPGTQALNSQATYASSYNGQGVQMTFAGTAGQYVSVGVLQACSYDYGFIATVINPDGTTSVVNATSVLSSAGCITSQQTVANNTNVVALPMTGNYTVLVQPTRATKLSFTVYLGGTVPGTLTINGSSVVSGLSIAGQGAQLTFSGTAAQLLAVTIVSSCSSIKGATVYILKPDQSALTTTALPSGACTGGYTGTLNLNIPTLPTTGTYTVLVRQSVIGVGSLTTTLKTR